MHQTTLRYSGECRKCGQTIEAGTVAAYERAAGLFCLECQPTDPEDLRAYRADRAEAKAKQLRGWAEKREAQASAVLGNLNLYYRGDFAFNAQPGHIPERARVVRREIAASESLEKARRMRERANKLERVRVRGDAERRRDAKRDAVRQRLSAGQKAVDPWFGEVEVIRVNRKSATILTPTGNRIRIELARLIPVETP